MLIFYCKFTVIFLKNQEKGFLFPKKIVYLHLEQHIPTFIDEKQLIL